jgi:hypothetical protein
MDALELLKYRIQYLCVGVKDVVPETAVEAQMVMMANAAYKLCATNVNFYGLDCVLDEVAAVLADGAKKHGDTGYEDRYVQEDYRAAIRHIERWRLGESADKDSGRHPLAHAIARLMMVAWRDINHNPDTGKMVSHE